MLNVWEDFSVGPSSCEAVLCAGLSVGIRARGGVWKMTMWFVLHVIYAKFCPWFWYLWLIAAPYIFRSMPEDRPEIRLSSCHWVGFFVKFICVAIGPCGLSEPPYVLKLVASFWAVPTFGLAVSPWDSSAQGKSGRGNRSVEGFICWSWKSKHSSGTSFCIVLTSEYSVLTWFNKL